MNHLIENVGSSLIALIIGLAVGRAWRAAWRFDQDGDHR